MRFVNHVAMVALGLGLLVLAGCSGPRIDKFHGQVVQDGKPVAFPEGASVNVDLIPREKGRRVAGPVKPDGSFQIDSVPLGKYNARLTWFRGKGGPQVTNSAEFDVEEGKTEYTIELGKDFKR